LKELDEFVTLVQTLDLVITIDNSIAHIAGALGDPTWLLLPKIPEWRWGITGDGSLWYSSLKLIRQEKKGIGMGYWKITLRKTPPYNSITYGAYPPIIDCK